MKRSLAGLFLVFAFWTAFSQAQVTGSGTANTIPIWTGKNTLGNSAITQNGASVGIGGTNAGSSLYVVSGNANGEAVLGYGDVEQLGELVAVFDAADGARDLVLAFGAGAAGDLVGEFGQRRFGGPAADPRACGHAPRPIAGSCRRPAAHRETRAR